MRQDTSPGYHADGQRLMSIQSIQEQLGAAFRAVKRYEMEHGQSELSDTITDAINSVGEAVISLNQQSK